MGKTKRIAIIGAGPVGLEAAFHARQLGHEVQLYERGAVGQHLLEWGHVRFFSPFGLNRSDEAAAALREAGHPLPADDRYLTGAEYVAAFLQPLAALPLMQGVVQPEHEVIAIGREGMLKHHAIGGARDASPFRLLLRSPDGETIAHADWLIDCSGCWTVPNALGNGGIPAPGERDAGDRIHYHVADYAGADRERFEGRRILVVGSGYSAATALDALRTMPDTTVYWSWRSRGDAPYHLIDDDPLPERRRLAEQTNAIADGSDTNIDSIPGSWVEAIRPGNDGALQVQLGGDSPRTIEVDTIAALVGYRPDRRLYEELQVHECWATAGPMKLAATLLAGSSNDCLAQTSSGRESLTSPEPNFFILGAKSYGKNSSFLIRLGLEQIREVFSS